jgi:NAD-dependent deacetylase
MPPDIPVLAKQSGAQVVQINPSSTPLDRICTWSISGAAGMIMPLLMDAAFSNPDR